MSMVEDQSKEVSDILEKLHLSPVPILHLLKNLFPDDADAQSVTSGLISRSGSFVAGRRFHLDYLVFGYCANKTNLQAYKYRDTDLDVELYDVVIDSLATKPYYPPWSEEEALLVHKREKEVNVVLSPFTCVIGTANKLDCFCEDTFDKQEFDEKILVRVRTQEDSSPEAFLVKGIVLPKKFASENSLQICKKVNSSLLDKENEHFISSAISLKDGCTVKTQYAAEEAIEIGNNEDVPIFCIRNLEFEAIDGKTSHAKIHDPHKFQKIPNFYYAQARSGSQNVPGLLTTKKWFPFIMLALAILLIAIPGLIQAFWAEDGKGGDIFNACIGIGSVLFGVLLSIFYCMFNTSVFSVKAWKGEFSITNDFAARRLLPSVVKKLESMSCDPRLPSRLVANMNNCAVRARKNGWLAIGKSIKLTDMKNHGYHVIRKKGLVIDLIESRVLVCIKKKDSKVVHLVRSKRQQNNLLEYVTSFEGDEIFGGFGRSKPSATS